MEENDIIAENAVHGVTDISGVKDGSACHPEGVEENVLCDAGKVYTDAKEDADAIEAEFDALISGKYKDVYKKRTESIIRKRIKTVRKEPDAVAPQASQEETVVCTDAETQAPPQPITTEVRADAEALARQKNRSRPVENGLFGSCGVVARINVDALSGSDVITLLKRAGTGEKISFK